MHQHTIQLLRDGLYRACAAYMKVALDRTSYTAILADFGNLMVTMLLSEMAVGNVGSAAPLTGSTTAGTPAGDAQAATARAATAAAKLKAERDKQETDTRALVGMPKPAGAVPRATRAEPSPIGGKPGRNMIGRCRSAECHLTSGVPVDNDRG